MSGPELTIAVIANDSTVKKINVQLPPPACVDVEAYLQGKLAELGYRRSEYGVRSTKMFAESKCDFVTCVSEKNRVDSVVCAVSSLLGADYFFFAATNDQE